MHTSPIYDESIFVYSTIRFAHISIAYHLRRLFSYTACSDPGIAFAPRPAYNSSDEDSNVGISLVNAVQSHVNSVNNAGDGERESFDVDSNGSSRSGSSKSDDHHYETHAEEGMQGDIEDGLHHNNSHSDASLVPQNALNVGTTSGMSNRISISGGNRIRVGNSNNHTNNHNNSGSSTSSSGMGALNHPSSVGNGNNNSNGHGTSGGSLNGVTLPHPRLPPPALIECGRCQIDRYSIFSCMYIYDAVLCKVCVVCDVLRAYVVHILHTIAVCIGRRVEFPSSAPTTYSGPTIMLC